MSAYPFKKTWIQFKIDFRKAVKELRRAGDLKVKDLHANLVSDIVAGIQEAIQPPHVPSPSNTFSSSPTMSTIFQDDPSDASTVQLNNVSDFSNLQDQIAQMQQIMVQMQT